MVLQPVRRLTLNVWHLRVLRSLGMWYRRGWASTDVVAQAVDGYTLNRNAAVRCWLMQLVDDGLVEEERYDADHWRLTEAGAARARFAP